MKLGIAFVLSGTLYILSVVTCSNASTTIAPVATTDYSPPTDASKATMKSSDKDSKKLKHFERKRIKEHRKANEQLTIKVQQLLANPGLPAAKRTDLNAALSLLRRAADSRDVKILNFAYDNAWDAMITAL